MKKQDTKRIGRPPLTPGVKAQRIAISLNPALIAHAEQRATASGESLSSFIGSLIESDMAGPSTEPLEARVERLETRMDALENKGA